MSSYAVTLPGLWRPRLNALWAFLTGRQERPALYLASRDGQTLARPTEPQEVHVIGQVVQASPATLRQLFEQVLPFVAKRSSIPVLGCVYIEQNEFDLTFKATDMESYAVATAESHMAAWGKFVIDAPAVKSMLEGFKDAEYLTMHAEQDSTKLHVTAGASSSDVWMVCLPAVDFPQRPEPKGLFSYLRMDDAELGGVMPWVLKSVATDETRPVLMAVALHRQGELLTFVSTDSYRMHTETLWQNVDTDLPNGIYPVMKDVLQGLSKKFGKTPGEWLFQFPLTEKGQPQDHVVITAPDGLNVVGRMSCGQFPNYRQLIPDTPDTMMVVAETKPLLAAVEAARKLLDKDSPMRISVTPANGTQTLSIEAEAMDRGSVKNELEVDVHQQGGFDPAAGFCIGVNPDFFAQTIDKREPETWLQFISPLRPLMVWPGRPDRQALMMPIRLSD